MISVVTLSPAPLLDRLADLHGEAGGDSVVALSLFLFHVPNRSSCLLLDLPPPRGSPFGVASAKQLAAVLGCSGGVRVNWSEWSGRWSRGYLVPAFPFRDRCQLSLPPGVILPRKFPGTLPILQLLGILSDEKLH